MLIGLGIAAALAFLFFLLWPATAWWVERVDGVDLDAKDLETGKDRQALLDKARGRFTALATGILAAIAIIYTASNARSARDTAKAAISSSEASHRAAEASERTTQAAFDSAKASQKTARAAIRTAAATERGLVTSRFTAAVEQLGNTNPAIQLGGVHALVGIADDEPTMRQTCIDVLCAYLRLPYDPDPGKDGDLQDRKAFQFQREVRHTILRLIGNHLRLPDDHPHCWCGHDFDFTDVIFDGADLHEARFTTGRISFRDAHFSSGMIDFGGAEFTGGEVSFWDAEFTGGEVNFVDAEFTGGRVDFWRAHFSGGTVDFGGAEFTGGEVSFWGAKFSSGEVSFVVAEFTGGTVDFVDAEFTGGTVDFREAVGERLNELPGPGEEIPAGLLLPEAWLSAGEEGQPT